MAGLHQCLDPRPNPGGCREKPCCQSWGSLLRRLLFLGVCQQKTSWHSSPPLERCGFAVVVHVESAATRPTRHAPAATRISQASASPEGGREGSAVWAFFGWLPWMPWQFGGSHWLARRTGANEDMTSEAKRFLTHEDISGPFCLEQVGLQQGPMIFQGSLSALLPQLNTTLTSRKSSTL